MKQKVPIVWIDDLNMWEVVLFEREVGHPIRRIFGPKSERVESQGQIVDLALLWLSLRRKMPALTIQEAGEGPFEPDWSEWESRAAQQTESDEGDDSDPLDHTGAEHGTPSST